MTPLLVLLGAALASDQTSLGQFMLARPLVAASLTGWILGDPAAGLVVGALLEVLFLSSFPVGGARFPEGGPAGVVAAVAAVEGAGSASVTGAGVALGVGLGAVWSLLGGWSVTLLRRLNERFVAVPDDGLLPPRRVVVGHVGALLLDFLRGAGLTALGLAGARLLAPLGSAAWPLSGGETIIVLAIVGGLSVGGLIAVLDGWRRRRRILLSGLALGAITGWLL